MTFDEWCEASGVYVDRLERLMMRKAWDAAIKYVVPEEGVIALLRESLELAARRGENTNGWPNDEDLAQRIRDYLKREAPTASEPS